MDNWQRLLASGDPGEVEARLRRFDGEYRWFLFRALPGVFVVLVYRMLEQQRQEAQSRIAATHTLISAMPTVDFSSSAAFPFSAYIACAPQFSSGRKG